MYGKKITQLRNNHIKRLMKYEHLYQIFFNCGCPKDNKIFQNNLRSIPIKRSTEYRGNSERDRQYVEVNVSCFLELTA